VLVAVAWRAPLGDSAINEQPGQTIARPVSAGGPAGFDTGEALSVQELTSQADLIVIGRAVDSRSQWTGDGRNLYTLVTIEVEETLKGTPVDTIVVAVPGGIDANRKFPVAMTYPGAPRITPDEQVVLFANDSQDEMAGTYAVAGYAQGKFTVEMGAGERMVRVGDGSIPLATFTQTIRGFLQ
jgi:hypothetical protein